MFCACLDNRRQKKFAPAYCLRFKFNCNNEAKKGHVCCIYPLPENGQATDNNHKSPLGPKLHIRPIKLPAKTRQPSIDGSNPKEDFKKPQKTTNNNKKNSRPGTSPLNRKSVNKNRSTSPRPDNRKRPRICQRLVVNCKTSPDHRCCSYEQKINTITTEASVTTSPTTTASTTLKPARTSTRPTTRTTTRTTTASTTPKPARTSTRKGLPVKANSVKVGDPPVVVKGEAIPVPLENPKVQAEVEKYEKIINDEVGSIPDTDEPYQRIPAECFTESFNCDDDPTNKCCTILE